jgi:hypothetical protein
MRGGRVSSMTFSSADWRKSSRSGTNGTGACVEVAWRKSSRSGQDSSGACVEVAVVGAAVGVRDSKSGGGTHLVFGDAAWRAFAEGMKTDRV